MDYFESSNGLKFYQINKSLHFNLQYAYSPSVARDKTLDDHKSDAVLLEEPYANTSGTIS